MSAKKPSILSKNISSLLILGVLGAWASGPAARADTLTWDGGGVGGTDLGTAVNWSTDVLPSVVTPDIAQWDGSVGGPLALIYSNAAFAGGPGNFGLNLSLTATQASALNIDSGANTATLRLNDITIAAGAGTFSLGDGVNAFNMALGGAGGQTHTWTNNSANTALIASDVLWGLGGGGAHTLALGGTGNWNLTNVVAQGTGVLTLTKNGSGALTLSGLNTYTGGAVLNAGIMNINNAGAIGNTAVGALTINGGTIDNTSGALVTTTTAKAQNWNGDFTFTGSNNLSFNLGAVVIGGTTGPRTVTVSNGTLSTGIVFSPIGSGLTKSGTGTLSLANTANTTNIGGALNITAGLVQIAGDALAGGLTGSGTIENGGAVSKWLFIRNYADNIFSGTIRNGTVPAATLGLNKSGTGTLTLTGTTTYTAQTTLAGGGLEYGATSLTGTARTVGNLVFANGDGVIKSSSDGSGTASLTFLTSESRTAGATGNFIIAGGVNGTSNSINLTKAAGFLDQGTFFNGSSYATMNGLNTYVRGVVYDGSDAGAVTSGAAVSLASATHQEFTGAITAQTTATFTTLKDSGNNAFTLDPAATVTTNGILKTGNVAGGATISGGVGLQAASGAELVIRTDGLNDALTINTPILANGANALTTSGAGTLTLGGANTYTGTTFVNSRLTLSGSILGGAVNVLGGGTFDLSGSMLAGAVNISGGGTANVNATGVINAANANSGQITVGNATGGNAILNINGGTVRAGKNTSPSIAIGNAANASGFLRVTSGTLTTGSELHIGNGAGAAGLNPYAAFSQTGGAVTSANWVVVAANNDRAVLNQSGGTFTVTANKLTIGAGGTGSVGVVNLSGTSVFNDAAGINVGENGTGILNVSGGAALNLGAGTLQFGGNASSLAGTINLLGGTVSTSAVTKGAGTAPVNLLNFNGGTLKATAAGTLMAALASTTAYVYGGGGTIDNGGFGVTVAQALLAPTGSGVNGVASFTGGAGYLDTPVVQIFRGTGDTTGVGATAVANVAGGVVTGITITNPGTGYTATPVFSLYGGGFSTAATVTPTAPTATVAGGLNFAGSGTTTLTGVNTYSGVTTIGSGALALGGAGSINASSGITVNGSGAKLVQTSSTAINPVVTLTNGTVDGTGLIDTVTVGSGTGGVVTHGNGGAAQLSIGTLTFTGAASMSLKTSTALQTTPGVLVTALNTGTVNAAGKVVLNATNTDPWNNGDYYLVGYTSLGGVGFSGFQKGTIAGLGARQSATLANLPGFVGLTIGGDFPVWTGAQNGNWTTNVIGGASNWKLQTAGTPTNFITNDSVLFDDTATGTTAVVISTANVSTTTVTFNNSVAYTVSSPGGFGISAGTLVKSGSGSVDLNTINTYAGGTTLNSGTLNLNSTSAIGTGALTIAAFSTIDNTSGSAKTLTTNNLQNWNGDFTFAGTNDLNLGTGAVTLGSNVVLTMGGTATLTVGGVISGSAFGLTKNGTNALTLSGASTYTGATTVSQGTLTLTGSLNAGNSANAGLVTVGDSSGSDALLNIVGGTVLATRTTVPSVAVGSVSGSNGFLKISAGTLTTSSELHLGRGAGGYAAFSVTGGTVTSGNWLVVGLNNDNAVLNQSGGAITVSANRMTIGAGGAGSVGLVNLSGGTFTSNAGIFIGENGTGTLNISGTAAVTAGNVQFNNAASSLAGTLNLRGGALNTATITQGVGTGTYLLNFNGGTLRATAAGTLMANLANTSAYIYSGGGTLDTGAFAVTFAEPLLAPTGNGVSATGLTFSGAGYLDTPLVAISGDGIGATAVANIDGGGNLTGITITNPGTGYTTAPTFTLLTGGGANNTGSIGGTATLVPNVGGGLTKAGTGSLTLTSANTYSGATVLSAGTLVLATGGSINGSSAITVNGTGAKLLQTNTATAISPTVTLTTGTLDGTGSLSAVTVGNGTGGVIANGNGTTAALTIGTLTFNGAATLNLATASTSPVLLTTTLTTSPGLISINASNTGWVTGQVYNLISYSTLNGSGFAGFNPTVTATGLGARQLASLTNPAGFIAISITGDTPVWTGALSDSWTTTPLPAPKNWKLQTGGTADDFLTNDAVLFNDTATGTTAVNISTASVSPASVTFNNSTLTYTISSTGGFGINAGSVTKNGSSSVTINTANTYTGGTTVNAGTLILTAASNFGVGGVTVNGGTATLQAANTYTGPTSLNGGTLNLNNGTAVGTSVITITGGTLDNTSGAQVNLTNNNAENWNGNFIVAGSNALNLGAGVATLGGAGTSRTITINAGTVSIGSINGTAGTGYGLTKAGPGTLLVGTAGSNLNGDLNVTAGLLQIGAQDFTATGLTGGGTIENGSATTRWVYLNNAADKSFSGILRDGTGGGLLGLNKSGTGTLTLTGANNYSSVTNVTAGKLIFSGTNINSTAVDAIGNTAGVNGVLVLSAGSDFQANFLNGGATFNTSISIGTNATGAGAVEINAASNFAAARQLTVGNPGYGAFSQSAGTATIGGFLAVGGSANGGVVNLSGGTFNQTGAPVTLGYVGTAGLAVMNVRGTAAFNQSGAGNGVWVGELGTAVLNVSGNAALTIANDGLNLGRGNGANSNGTVNLLGGVTTVNFVSKGTGTGVLNFNGGTLKANVATATFVSGLTSAYVYSGGATIDDGGFAVTIAQDFLAPTGNGVSATGLTVSGGGYIDTPIVQISGDGTGATAVATIDASGNLTGVTITNPGVDYTFATVSLVGGGIGNTGSISGSPGTVANTTGAITKLGAGQTTYSGVIGNGTSTFNANAGETVFTTSQTLSALNIGAGALVTLAESAPPAPFAGIGAASDFGGASAAASSAASVVPEPSTIGLLLVGALGTLSRRRRSR